MFVAESALYVAIACGERRKVENRTIQFSSSTPMLPICKWVRDTAYLQPARTANQIIRDVFLKIPTVSRVDIDYEDGEAHVQIAVPNDAPKELRYKIYEKQSYVARAFPEMLFDFNLKYVE